MRWEYLRVHEYIHKINFSDLGKQGWELVGVTAHITAPHFIFKRPAPPPGTKP
jgi:hypothetical protein